MKNFIRVVEYWVPSADGSLLEFGGGLFGSATRFAAASRDLCFGRGEGLPGQVWDAGHPIVLKDLQAGTFRRAAAARADGLTCGIAVPHYQGEALSAVTILFCGDDSDHAGAIELWRNDPAQSADMDLVDGYYGNTGDTFEFISRSISFRRGNGLPGMAWERQAPVFLPDLGKGSGFLRSDGAVRVGINRGIAIPCSTRDGTHQVMTFLSALATPLARGVAIWSPDPGGAGLVRSFAFAETDDGAPEPASMAVADPGPPWQAFSTGRPCVWGAMVAIPVAPQGRSTAVMALHF